MKKYWMGFLFILALAGLTACGEYDLTNRMIITDVKIDRIEEHHVGKSTSYSIFFSRDGEKIEELMIDDMSYGSEMKDGVSSIKKTSKVLETDEPLLFDLIVADGDVIEIVLSKNRK